MNNTKWKELVSAITSDPNYSPEVNIKYLFSEEVSNSYSSVWWDEVENEGFEIIEWIKIRSTKEEFQGRLVDPKTTDHTDFITKGLNAHNIPFEFENGIFTIHGYLRNN